MIRKTRNDMTFEGEPFSSTQCPVARWLREEPAFRDAIVSTGYASVLMTNNVILNVPCEAITEFVRWFDA